MNSLSNTDQPVSYFIGRLVKTPLGEGKVVAIYANGVQVAGLGYHRWDAVTLKQEPNPRSTSESPTLQHKAVLLETSASQKGETCGFAFAQQAPDLTAQSPILVTKS